MKMVVDLDGVIVPLCDAIEAQRLARVWTVERVAREAGLARLTVHRMLALRTDPKLSTIIKTAGALGLDVAIVVTPRR